MTTLSDKLAALAKHPMEELKDGIHSDSEYAWSWQCNLAVPIMEAIGASHKDANRAAALIMAHMFDYDITAHPRYEWGKSPQQIYFEARVASEREEDAALRQQEASNG